MGNIAETIPPQAIAALSILVIAGVFFFVWRRADRTGRARLKFLLSLGIIVFVCYYFLFEAPVYKEINQGLDLQGGVHVVLEAEDTPESKVDDRSMREAEDIIRERIDKLGVAEPLIQREGSRRIIVELPGVKDAQEAIDIIGKPAYLEFFDESGNVVVTGSDLKRADIAKTDEGYVVTLELNPDGAKQFAEATGKNIGRLILISLDKQLISAPQVREVIPDGRAQITGYETAESAYRMSVLLNSGVLPVKLNIVENRSMSATLGKDSIERSLRAAIIGITLVIVFMLAYYRLPGLLADFALGAYVVMLLIALKAINATLTLPGISGIILSVGMAVDANVLIFERIREEMRNGKTLWSAVEVGFSNALRAIIDSNITTLIAAAVLFWLGSGPVRGFAVTLSLGIGCSMLTAVVITRYLLRLMIRSDLVKNGRSWIMNLN
jgi:preprotein translocase subunit SecD